MLDFVCDYFRTRALDDENSLIVVVRDDVGVGERLDTDLSRDCDLIVVQILQVVRRLLLDFGRRFLNGIRKDGVCSSSTSDAPTFESADCLLLRCHERVVIRIYGLLGVRNEFYIRLFSAADMGDGVLGQLNAGFAVLLDDIASHVGIALTTLDDDAVVAACIYGVLPDLGRTQLRPISSSDLNAILMTSIDLILDQVGLIVVDFDSDFVEVEGVSNNERLDIKIGINGGASTEINPVVSDARPALLALDVDSVRVA